MAAITLKDFPDDVYRQLKIRAAEQGTTLRTLLIDTLAASVAKPTAADESPATPAAKKPAARRNT